MSSCHFDAGTNRPYMFHYCTVIISMAAIDVRFINAYHLPALFSWLANVPEV